MDPAEQRVEPDGLLHQPAGVLDEQGLELGEARQGGRIGGQLGVDDLELLGRLEGGDQVVGMDVARPKGYVLTVTSGGFGKLTPVADYPRQHRAGGGVRTFKLIDKTGGIAAAAVVSQSQQLMIISAEGIIIHTPVKEKDPKQGITIQGRSTQGVRLMKLDPGDRVVAIACFDKEAK